MMTSSVRDGEGSIHPEPPISAKRTSVGRSVEIRNSAAMIHRDDGIQRGLENGARAGLLLGGGCFHLMPAEIVPDLVSNRRHGREEIVVERRNRPAEEFDNAKHFFVAADREGKCTA